MDHRHFAPAALLLALALSGQARADTCYYQATDPGLTGDAYYSLYNGCQNPYFSYFWNVYDFDGVDWTNGFGYGDACNFDLALGRTLNALSALHYSSDLPDYTGSDGYNGTILEWAGVYAADKIDELDARCNGSSFMTAARTWYGPVIDNRTELYMPFFNDFNVAERASIILHEARHASWKNHDSSGCALGGQCDSSWGFNGAFRYQVAWAAQFAYRAFTAPSPVRQRLVDRANEIIDSSFTQHPGFYISDADVPLLGDVDGDGRDELVVWTPGQGWWRAMNTTTYQLTTSGLPFGGNTAGDTPLIGNFNADKKQDFAIWRPLDGTWHFITATGTYLGWQKLGQYHDEPLVGDFNGDGVDDIATWRPSDGTWRVSTRGGVPLYANTPFGQRGDRPLVGDYDGDGKDDLFIWRPSSGEWHVMASSAGGPQLIRAWGGPGDTPMLGDFNNDKKVDLVVWRRATGEWHAVTSAGAPLFVRPWGDPGDVPLLGKIDSNKTHDLVVWRPLLGTWWALGTNAGPLFGNVPFGMPY
jgi:hypothetical protein